MSTIPLGKGLNLSKMQFPAVLSEKFDGIPVKVVYDGFHITSQTRQGKPLPSVDDILDDFEMLLRGNGAPAFELVGEVVQDRNRRAPFRETGGIVRRQEPQEDLVIMVFDGSLVGRFNDTFNSRMGDINAILSWSCPAGMEMVHQQMVTTEDAFTFHSKKWMEANPDAEGMILRSLSSRYEPGKRQWGYQKVLNEPTIDLRIVGFEEAIDKHGEPKGMVGGLIASYKGTRIGIGPGKMTHREREELWGADFPYGTPGNERIAEIKHKGDDSYDALRQPTFQRWRDDKDEPDA